MTLSKRQVKLQYGLNASAIETLLRDKVLLFDPLSTQARLKITLDSLERLVEGEHFVFCQGCGARQAQITTKHLRFCSGYDLASYRERYPKALLVASDSSARKAKTTEQKNAQSLKLKKRFQTPEGEKTRQQISDAARQNHASGYREQAVAHLRALGKDPVVRARRKQVLTERWQEGSLRERVEGWHRDNREISLASAANARKHIKQKFSKLHMGFKSEMLKAGISGFISEFEVGFYSIDEAHPELKIALEVDGCYWHSCEQCGFPGVGEIKALDKRKTTYLTRRGWQIIRFREHDIKADSEQCIKQLMRDIAQRKCI